MKAMKRMPQIGDDFIFTMITKGGRRLNVPVKEVVEVCQVDGRTGGNKIVTQYPKRRHWVREQGAGNVYTSFLFNCAKELEDTEVTNAEMTCNGEKVPYVFHDPPFKLHPSINELFEVVISGGGQEVILPEPGII